MASWEEVSVRGCAELERVAGEHRKRGRRVFAFVGGDKDSAGVSWCPECVAAEPIVHAELPQLPKGSVFIHCQVGTKDQWKDPENDFRKKLKLTAIPTLLKFGTPQKLVEEECTKADLVRMLFKED